MASPLPAALCRAAAALGLSSLLSGCEQDPIIARSSRGGVTVLQATVGPRGAKLRSGDVEIEIPEGAVPINTTISVQRVPRGGASLASLRPASMAVVQGCGQLRPQGEYLYTLEPSSLVFAKDVRVGLATVGSAGGVTALTLEGASSDANGYALSGQRASIRLSDFSSSIDVQTLSPWAGAVYDVQCDATSCTATNSEGQPTVCEPWFGSYYSCQGPLGLPGTVTASSLDELRALMIPVAIGQGSSCSVASGPAPAPVCGDGQLDPGEACDGADLGGKTCVDALGPSATGTLACSASCALDPSGCQTSPACSDGTKNGTETDIDCGGGCPNKCADGKACSVAADCAGGACPGGMCAKAPTCTDGIKNQTETDTDCGGGGVCAPCADGLLCSSNTDCASNTCLGPVCRPATCVDTVQSPGESYIDCGGPCLPCADASPCNVNADCQSGVCLGECLTATCTDSVKNGDETDIDCGGSCSQKCAPNKSCLVPLDCQSGACNVGICSLASPLTYRRAWTR